MKRDIGAIFSEQNGVFGKGARLVILAVESHSLSEVDFVRTIFRDNKTS